MRLPTELTTQVTHLVTTTLDFNDDLTEMRASLEALITETALQHNKYNQSKTANSLGLARGTLRTKLKKFFGAKYL